MSSPSSSAVVLEGLRSLIKSVEKPLLRERYPFTSTPLGIPKGCLIEIVGPGKTETVAQFLRENPNLRVAWIEDAFTIYPCAIMQRKIRLHQVLFIEAKQENFWAASQVLRSGLFEIVVMSFQKQINEKVVRRLQLETEKANVSFFLLPENENCSPVPSASWPISMKLKMNATNRGISILRERG